jgi:hypothetical protein
MGQVFDVFAGVKHPSDVARALAVTVLCAVFLTGSAAGSAVGDVRVLVIRATWGPTPDTPTLANVAPFYERSSFGQLRLHLDETPWLPVYPGSICPSDQRAAKVAAGAAGFDVGSYGRIAVLLPDENACPFRGVARANNEILLAYAPSLTHELGHTFGLAHATSYFCARSNCRRIEEYGDPFSPMGHGTLDFSAYEKFKLGWITNVQRVAGSRTYTIGDIDTLGSLPQALVVGTNAGEYWIEHRSGERRVIVRLVKQRSIYISAPNNRFVAPNVFSVTRGFSFTWLDCKRPTQPQVHGLDETVIWWSRSRDTGSGIATYRVTLDGKPFTDTTEARITLPELHGTHRIAVVAVDRAGNRSRPGAVLLRLG